MMMTAADASLPDAPEHAASVGDAAPHMLADMSDDDERDDSATMAEAAR
jgi:hypothetical protein